MRAPARERWFVPPNLRTAADEAEPRHASWLELFFDLVFVVAITELSRQLVLDHSAGGFLRFVALFFPVYVAWQGYMAYADRFDTDDVLFRGAYFAAMLAIAAMAVLIGDVARGRDSAQFAVAYVCLRSFMLVLYLRAWRAVPEARPLIRFYGTGYAVGAAMWLASQTLPTPARYSVWVAAQVLELSLPPLTTRLHRRIRTSASHLPERWALFTLIVLGESVVAVAIGTAGTNWRPDSVGCGGARVRGRGRRLVAVLRRQEGVVLRGSTVDVVVYSYAHIPLLIGLAAMSAGLRMLIDRADHGHLGTGPAVALVGGAALYLLALVGTRTVTVGGPHRVGVSLKLGAVVVLLALLAVQGVLPVLAVAGGLAVVLVHGCVRGADAHPALGAALLIRRETGGGSSCGAWRRTRGREGPSAGPGSSGWGRGRRSGCRCVWTRPRARWSGPPARR